MLSTIVVLIRAWNIVLNVGIVTCIALDRAYFEEDKINFDELLNAFFTRTFSKRL